MCRITDSGIYKITSPSGRIYIGQSEKISKRWRDYHQMNVKTKGQIKLWRSFKKYNVTNHTFEIIEECEIDELNCRERYWQDFYDVLNGGLNCVLQECGDKRRKYSEETKQKRKLIPGRIPSEKEIEATRLRMIGNIYQLGRVRPQFEKDKISASMKLRGTQVKENNSMWGKTGENNPNCKLVLDLESGIFYYGVKEASVAKGIPYSSLKKMICGNRKNTTSLVYV